MSKLFSMVVVLLLSLPAFAQKTVYLKLDDLTGYPPRLAAFQRAAEVLASKGVKGSFGLIGNSLADPVTARRVGLCAAMPRFGPHVEIFHHGYDHGGYPNGTYEFHGTPDTFQRERLQSTLTLAQKCGVDIRAFGAPFNLTDAATVRAMEDTPQLHTWVFPTLVLGSSKRFLLTRDTRVDMEISTGVVDYCHFLEKYALAGSKTSIVLQGHPGGWNDASWTAFGKVIDLLKATGATFKVLSE